MIIRLPFPSNIWILTKMPTFVWKIQECPRCSLHYPFSSLVGATGVLNLHYVPLTWRTTLSCPHTPCSTEETSAQDSPLNTATWSRCSQQHLLLWKILSVLQSPGWTIDLIQWHCLYRARQHLPHKCFAFLLLKLNSENEFRLTTQWLALHLL